MAIRFQGAHCPQEVIRMGVRWYVAYPLSTRHVEELMAERGVETDHSTINRWTVQYSPLLEAAFHRRKRPVWLSWRMDETSMQVKGQWRYLYRAVDKYGATIDFWLTEHRDKEAALTKRPPSGFSRRPAAGTAPLSPARVLAVTPMKRPSRAITRSTGPPSPCARASISIMWWSRTIEE